MTISVPDLQATVAYEGSHGVASWAGYGVEDQALFRQFVSGSVRARVRDADVRDDFEGELRGLATTGMASEFLERLLLSVPEEFPWDVGEALAESILEEDTEREVIWPWNTARDRRTPRASLPGADLVGFCRQDDVVVLLFGEVKTSADSNAPPGVMYGGSGMIWQLEANATRLDVQHTLLKWLRGRCTSEEHVQLYRSAVRRYLGSGGKEILIVGVLLRDTEPNELDISNRATSLANALHDPTRVEVIAWYLPVPISEWADLLQGDAP